MSIIAVLLIIVTLALLSAAVALFVSTGAVVRTNDLVKEEAFYLSHAGLEYALKRIDEGVDPDGNARTLGNGQFTVGYSSATGVISSSASVSAMQGSSSQSYSIQGPTSGWNMADCLTFSATSAYLGSPGTTKLKDMDITNTCTSPITISTINVSWTPVNSERVTRVNITSGGGTWNGSATSGSTLDISDFVLGACTTRRWVSIDFDTNMGDQNFTIVMNMSDGTTKTGFVQFVADNEAACMNADLGAAVVGGTGFVDLQNGTLTNACSAPTSIRIKQMTVSWAPTTPARTMTTVRIGGANRWTGSVPSGTAVTLSTPVQLNAGASATQNYLRFSSDMRGYNYTIIYKMWDNTTLSIPVSLYATNMSSCLTVDTTGASISTRSLLGQVWQNSCPKRIVIDRVQTTWTGTSRTLQNIRVGGSSVWSGSAGSGATVDISNVDIIGGGSQTVDRYYFNNTMVGRCFTHVMTMFDGTTLTKPSYCP
jgi:hypothetical protein